MKIKFVYGNSYKLLKKGEYRCNRGGRPLPHSWVSYFNPISSKYKVGDFVKRITWTLHDSFKDPIKVKNKAPFTHECTGCWGYFDVPFKVEFLSWTGLKP